VAPPHYVVRQSAEPVTNPNVALPPTRLERALDHRHQRSFGCIRICTENVIDLYQRVKVGTKVVVI